MAPKFALTFVAAFFFLWLQNGQVFATVDLDTTVFQVSYNVLLNNVASGGKGLLMITRLETALEYYRKRLPNRQDDFADALFDAVMHLAHQQSQPDSGLYTISIEDQFEEAVQQMELQLKGTTAEQQPQPEPFPSASELSPNTVGRYDALRKRMPASEAGAGVDEKETTPQGAVLIKDHHHITGPASPSQHKRSHHSAASTSVVDASVIDSEHREIVEPNFDLKSLEAFKEFYEHIRVGELKGEVQDMVSHLKDITDHSGKRLLHVMLLFYNLYKECRDEKENREMLALDPRSSYSWLAKVNDRTFKLLLSMSQHPDVLNQQLLGHFRTSKIESPRPRSLHIPAPVLDLLDPKSSAQTSAVDSPDRSATRRFGHSKSFGPEHSGASIFGHSRSFGPERSGTPMFGTSRSLSLGADRSAVPKFRQSRSFGREVGRRHTVDLSPQAQNLSPPAAGQQFTGVVDVEQQKSVADEDGSSSKKSAPTHHKEGR